MGAPPCTLPDVSVKGPQPIRDALSDVTEADEPSRRDSSEQDAAVSPDLLRPRAMSYSSFGSSYPSSPELRDVKATYQILETSTFAPAVRVEPREAENAPERPPAPVALAPGFVPFVVEPLLSSSSVDQPEKVEGVGDSDGGRKRETEDERLGEVRVDRDGESKVDDDPAPATTTELLPSVSTYADATNVSCVSVHMSAPLLMYRIAGVTASRHSSRYLASAPIICFYVGSSVEVSHAFGILRCYSEYDSSF